MLDNLEGQNVLNLRRKKKKKGALHIQFGVWRAENKISKVERIINEVSTASRFYDFAHLKGFPDIFWDFFISITT